MHFFYFSPIRFFYQFHDAGDLRPGEGYPSVKKECDIFFKQEPLWKFYTAQSWVDSMFTLVFFYIKACFKRLANATYE